MNILAATSTDDAANEIYNVALNDRTTLNELYDAIYQLLVPRFPHLANRKPIYRDFRPGDVRHSMADITKASILLGYEPSHSFKEGLKEAMDWYINNLSGSDMTRKPRSGEN